MDQLPVSVPGLQHLMRQTFDRKAIDLPFGEDIYLRCLPIAGLAYHEASAATAELISGAKVVLKREPANVHDQYAVAVLSQKGRMLGYLPRRENRILARLLDAGKQLIARVDYAHIQDRDADNRGFGNEIKVRIFLSAL
jgi:hypothetical protein